MPLKRALYDLGKAAARYNKKQGKKRSKKQIAKGAKEELSSIVTKGVEIGSDVTRLLPIPPAVKVPVATGLDLSAEVIGDFAADIASPAIDYTVNRLIQDPIPQPLPTQSFELPYSEYPQFNLPPAPIARATPRMEVKTVTPIEILEAVINEPALQLTEDMLPAINDPGVFMRNGQMMGQFSRSNLLGTKKKRKVSKYQKEFGKQLKLLKKKHPRIPVTRLMKRAHAATRKALKR